MTDRTTDAAPASRKPREECLDCDCLRCGTADCASPCCLDPSMEAECSVYRLSCCPKRTGPEALLPQLYRVAVEKYPYACEGCRYEHNCKSEGCAVIRLAEMQIRRMADAW